MSPRELPPETSITIEAAVGPMLSAELKSLVSELARARRELEVMEKRVIAVIERLVTRCVELQQEARDVGFGERFDIVKKRRPVKLVRP